MKIFKIEKKRGRVRIYLFKVKIFSFKRSDTQKKLYNKLYARRFDNNLSIKDKKFILKYQFENSVGYKPDIDNPKSFNEKIQWLKLYYHDPLMTKCADKFAVREYIKNKIGEKYLVPLLGVWDSVDDIDWDLLPNQFALKINWGSGQNIICSDKSKLDIDDAKEKLRKWMNPKSNHYFYSFEWAYKNIKPKIIAEKYIEQIDGDLFDYKFQSYNGEIKNFFLCSERSTDVKMDFFDMKFNKYPFNRAHGNNFTKFKMPKNYDEMLKLSNILSADFPFVRVDWFNVNGKLYFSELTFYSDNGMGPFNPSEWDFKFGGLFTLPNKRL